MTDFLPRERPGSIIAGVGCSSAASAAEIIALVESCLAEAGFLASDLIAVTSHERKAGHPGLAAAAVHFGVPVRLLPGHEMVTHVPNPSALVFAAVGFPSVAEASAAAAGPLVLPKRISAHVTCAVAREMSQPFNDMASIAASTLATSSAGP